jgi:hypothetical protein
MMLSLKFLLKNYLYFFEKFGGMVLLSSYLLNPLLN